MTAPPQTKPEMEFHMINMIYVALSMRAQTEKTTLSCKDDCTLMKHTQHLTYSARDFEIPLCHIPSLRSFLFARNNLIFEVCTTLVLSLVGFLVVSSFVMVFPTLSISGFWFSNSGLRCSRSGQWGSGCGVGWGLLVLVVWFWLSLGLVVCWDSFWC